ncbi:hypothetical protein cypCar_00045782 [Cyprinus carpio]|nr:hypothetical protein cypCar_00045782 [Cyprinus carpio]
MSHRRRITSEEKSYQSLADRIISHLIHQGASTSCATIPVFCWITAFLDKMLINCGVTDEGCAALSSALRSNPSHLRELNLSWNKLIDSVKVLSVGLEDPHCKLEKLWLSDCGVTDKGCAALTSALRSNPSHLRELSLSWNKLRDSVKLLSDVLQNPHCKLEKLRPKCAKAHPGREGYGQQQIARRGAPRARPLLHAVIGNQLCRARSITSKAPHRRRAVKIAEGSASASSTLRHLLLFLGKNAAAEQ